MFIAEVIGNLGAAAEVVRANGSEFIKFRVADTRKWRDATGRVCSETMWVDVTLNNAQSGLLPYLVTGALVYVSGPISTRVYSSQRDRCMKAGITIHAHRIQLLGSRGDGMPSSVFDDNGVQHMVLKWYYVEGPRNAKLRDIHGCEFIADANGLLSAAPTNYVENPVGDGGANTEQSNSANVNAIPDVF